MSDFLNPTGSAQPAPAAFQPPVAGSPFSGTVSPGGASLVSMPEPSSTTPTEMPTGATPSVDSFSPFGPLGGMPPGQMDEPGPGELGEMPKGVMNEH